MKAVIFPKARKEWGQSSDDLKRPYVCSLLRQEGKPLWIWSQKTCVYISGGPILLLTSYVTISKSSFLNSKFFIYKMRLILPLSQGSSGN